MRWRRPQSAVPTARSLGSRVSGTRHHRLAKPRPGSGRLGAPPSRKAPSKSGLPIRWARWRAPISSARLRELSVPVLADPEVTLWAGSPSLVACEMSILPARLLQEAGGIDFWMAHPIHRNGYLIPRPSPVVHRLSTDFIHAPADRSAGIRCRPSYVQPLQGCARSADASVIPVRQVLRTGEGQDAVGLRSLCRMRCVRGLIMTAARVDPARS